MSDEKDKSKGGKSDQKTTRIEYISPTVRKISDTGKESGKQRDQRNGDGWDKIDKKGSGAGDRPKR